MFLLTCRPKKFVLTQILLFWAFFRPFWANFHHLRLSFLNNQYGKIVFLLEEFYQNHLILYFYWNIKDYWNHQTSKTSTFEDLNFWRLFFLKASLTFLEVFQFAWKQINLKVDILCLKCLIAFCTKLSEQVSLQFVWKIFNRCYPKFLPLFVYGSTSKCSLYNFPWSFSICL